LGYKRWRTLKRAVEVWLGRRVSDEFLCRGIRKLTEVSIFSRIEDEYEFFDPVYREATKQL